MNLEIDKNITSIIMLDVKSLKQYETFMQTKRITDFLEEKKNHSFLTFKFCLPYILHIEEDKNYSIKIDSETAKIRFKKKHTEKVKLIENEKPSFVTKSNGSEFDEITNGELVRDVSGKFWFSEILLKIPFSEKEMEFFKNKKLVPQDALRTYILVRKIILFLNKFLFVYRNSFFQPQIKQITLEDLKLIYLKEKKSHMAISIINHSNLLDCRLSSNAYGITEERIKHFRRGLTTSKKIPIWVDFMNNAHLHFIKKDFRMCIIECYIILESYIKDLLEDKLPKKLNENLYNKLYKTKKENLSLGSLYDEYLEMATKFSLKNEEPLLWKKFKDYKKIRNHAVHQKLFEINEKEAEDCLNNTNKIINSLQIKIYNFKK